MFLLRCRSSYSDPEAPPPRELANWAAAEGIHSLALTEVDNLDSIVEAPEVFRTRGLDPVVGLDWTGIGGGERLLLFARTRNGFRDLITLLSRPLDPSSTAQQLGLKSLPDGLFVLCNPPGSLLRSLLAKGREREALAMVQRYLEWFGRRALRVVLPPDLGTDGAEEQRRTLGALAREGVRFVGLGSDEQSGRPLADDEMAAAFVRCQAAVHEAKQVLDGCEFRWEPPAPGLAQVTPGRGYRSESFVWDRCHQALVQKYGSRRRDAEKRLYAEFQAFRDANLFDLMVALHQVEGRTSLGHPLIWPVNPWVVTTLVGHLLGLTPGDPIRLSLTPEIPVSGTPAKDGVDVTLLLGRGEWRKCAEALEGIFGNEHVVFRKGRPVGRPPADAEPDLFSDELGPDNRPIPPVTEILVSRFRWMDFLPAREAEDGHHETTLPGAVTARLPLYRFHLRTDKLLSILTLAARDLSHQGRRLDLFADPDEVFRSLIGSDGGRGILRLGFPGLSSLQNYLRLRTRSAEKGPARRPVGLDEALDRAAAAFSHDRPQPGERLHRLTFAHKLLAVSSLSLNYPRSYYMALFSTVELELPELRKVMAEITGRGIRVSGPDINQSQADTVLTDDGMRLGLRCIRGIGPVISRSLVGSRQRQPFVSLQDLCRRTDRRTVNRRVLDCLIDVGALDTLGDDREAQKAALAWILGGREEGGLQPRQLSLFPEKGAGAGERAGTGRGLSSLGRSAPRRPVWEIFDAGSLATAVQTFDHSGFERIARLKQGGPRAFAAWGWFIDLFPPSEANESPWGFFADGHATIPVVVPDGGIGLTPSGPWVIRGACAGRRPSWRRLLPLLGGSAERNSLPACLRDLPTIIALDLETLHQAADEAANRTALFLRVGTGRRSSFRELAELLRIFQVRDGRGGRIRLEGDPGWHHRRRLRRLSRRPVLALDLALRWLRSIPVVRNAEIEEQALPFETIPRTGSSDRESLLRACPPPARPGPGGPAAPG